MEIEVFFGGGEQDAFHALTEQKDRSVPLQAHNILVRHLSSYQELNKKHLHQAVNKKPYFILPRTK